MTPNWDCDWSSHIISEALIVVDIGSVDLSQLHDFTVSLFS